MIEFLELPDMKPYMKTYPRACRQEWNLEKGEFLSEVSHVMRKGSTRRNSHFGNVFPNCRIHHMWMESLTPALRRNFIPIGQKYYEEFLREGI